MDFDEEISLSSLQVCHVTLTLTNTFKKLCVAQQTPRGSNLPSAFYML